MKFDIVKTLSVLESIAVIGGIVFAVWQVLEISKQTTIQADTLKQTQKIASADLVLKLRATLDDTKFAKLVADIQNHDHNYPLLSRSDGGKGGKFRDLEIEQYISVFEDIGYLVEGNLIIGTMAYNEFSYDVEKTWCNADVRRMVVDARKVDKSSTRQSDPTYGNLQKLAESYLTKERQTCKDLDNQ